MSTLKVNAIEKKDADQTLTVKDATLTDATLTGTTTLADATITTGTFPAAGITAGTLGSDVSYPAGMVVFSAAKVKLSSGPSTSSTNFAEISSSLRIEVTPKSTNNTIVCHIAFGGCTMANADLEVKLYWGSGSGSTPNTYFGDTATGYAGPRMGQGASQLVAWTSQVVIPSSAMWTGTKVLSPFYRSSNGNTVNCANSAYNYVNIFLQEIAG
jgi:hypothetical protein